MRRVTTGQNRDKVGCLHSSRYAAEKTRRRRGAFDPFLFHGIPAVSSDAYYYKNRDR